MLGGDYLLGVVCRCAVLLSADALDLGDGLGAMTTPRQPRLESSGTGQISDSALVSPGIARESYAIVSPPSMTNCTPVMKAPASEAR